MAEFKHLETDTGTNVDISSPTAIGSYTATADKLVLVDVSIDAVAGNGDYVMYVKRKIGGTGSDYIVLPKTTMTAASGETAISGQSGWITVRDDDVLTVYVDGLAGDTATPDYTTRWFELAGVTAAAVADAVWDEATSGHTSAGSFSKAVTDILADTGTDGVKIASGELSTVATASSITALDGKIDTIDNFLDTEIADILADTNELQAELADGGRTDLLIDAIKAKTDTIAAAPTAASVADAVWDEAIADHTSVGSFGAKNQKVVPSETINDYKADVSGLATTTALSTVSGLVDDLESRLTAARAGYLDNLNTGVALTAAGVDAILDEVIVGTYTMRQLLKVMAAALAGKATGGGTTEVKFSGVDDAPNVIVATVDANGNRSAVTLTV